MSVGNTFRAIVLIFVATGATASAQSSTTIIKHVRVFDGQRLLGKRDVLVVAGTIAQVAPGITHRSCERLALMPRDALT